MTLNPKFSVIIPAYNAEKTISHALKSLVSQDFCDFEVVVIDDGSTDTTSEIVKGFKDKRICLVKSDNKGPGVARNIGIEQAKGDWVFCLDADDFVDANLFSRVSEVLTDKIDVVLLNFATFNEKCKTKFPAGWSYRNTRVFPDDSKTIFTYEENVDLFLETVQSIPWNKIVRRKLLDDNDIKFSEIYLSEDMMYSFPACMLAKGLVRIRQPLVFHSEYSNQSAMDKKYEHPLDFLEALAQLKEFFVENDRLEVFHQAYRQWTLQSLSYNVFSHTDERARAIQIDACVKVIPKLIGQQFDTIKIVEPKDDSQRCSKQMLISKIVNTKFGFSVLDKTIHFLKQA